MKLNVHIKEIDYADIILKAMPVLKETAPRDGSALAKIVSAAAGLPDEVIRTVVEAVSQEDKTEIAALLVQENRDMLRRVIAQILKKNEIDVSVDEIVLRKELELCVGVSNLNYEALAAKFLPMIRDSLIPDNPITVMLVTLLKLPGMLLSSAIARIPQNKKDEAVAYLINKNQGKITAKAEQVLAGQGIHVRLDDLHVTA